MNNELDKLLYETARQKTAELPLRALLTTMQAQAGEPIGKTAQAKAPRQKIRRLTVYAAAAAAVLLLAFLPLLRKTVVVEGKTYLALGNAVKIDGEVYYLEAPDTQAQEAELLHIEGTNQYVKLPPAREEARSVIMVFPPDSGPQPERKPTQRARNQEAVTMEPEMVYPTIPGLVVRAGPGTGHEELAQLYTGECVYKVGMQGDWAILEWQGRIAYAYDAYLFTAPESIPVYPAVKRYATEELNVRMMPGSRDASLILGDLALDQEVLCTGVIGGWSQIEWNGAKAYVFSQYLSAEPLPAAG